MHTHRVLFPSGLCAALALAALIAASDPDAAHAQRSVTPTPKSMAAPASLLRNGDFEGGSARQWNPANDEWVNGRVAEGWTAWWRRPTPPDGEYPGACPEDETACQPWHRPEYRETRGIPYDPPRARGGENAQMYFTSFGVYEGGLYQTVGGVPRGWSVRFSIWAKAWSSDTEDTAESTGQPSMGMRAGIDPSGGTDPWSDSVIWSEEIDSFDEFGEYSVIAVTRAETITVFFRSRPERALKHVDVMLDDAELILIGPPPPTPFVIRPPSEAASAPTGVPGTGGATPPRLEREGGAPQQVVIHVVQPGDTLFAIAQAYHAELSGVYALNGLNETSSLSIGQLIRVPLAAPTAASNFKLQTPNPTGAEHGQSPDPDPDPERSEGEGEGEGAAEGGAPERMAVGALCVRAFEDVAGDTRYNQGDGALAPALRSPRPEGAGSLEGAAFVVVDASGRAVASAAAARCFEDLPVGAYAVSAQAPAGYAVTTGARWDVSLTEGARVEVTAGMKRDGPPASGMPSGAALIATGATAGFACLAVLIMLNRRRARSSGAARDA